MKNCKFFDVNIKKFAINLVVFKNTKLGAGACGLLFLAIAGCAGDPSTQPLPFYRCEYGIEFSAKFVDDSVSVESTRGYDVLYRGGKYASTPALAKPTSNEYSNPRMQVEFNLGPTQREAIARYPLLPLVSRCVRDN